MGDTPKLLFYAQEKGETPLELALHNLHIVYLWHSNVAIGNPALNGVLIGTSSWIYCHV